MPLPRKKRRGLGSAAKLFADCRPQTDGNMLYYAADNSRLCVLRIVLAIGEM